MDYYPVILTGGAGSRLWPVSREFYPKPLLSIVGENSLLQETASRLESLEGIKPPLLVCNEEHRYLVAEQLQKKDMHDATILLEPLGRDTAPALTIAALQIMEENPSGIMVVMPADHVIPEPLTFSTTVKKAGDLANTGHIVTFGIVPDKPETGYGYIQKGNSIPASEGFVVDCFVEKPDVQTAESYLETGNYFWNGGIFVTRADTWLDEIGKYRPIILAACKAAMADRKIENGFKHLNKEAFLSCPPESIDYAVMENTERAAVLPMAAHWSDVGSWASIWEVSEQNPEGNVFKGDVISHGTSNSLIMSGERCIAAVGLDNIVIVDTPDAVLVADKNCSQDVKAIVGELKKNNRAETQFHSKVHRPWGNYEGIDRGQRYQVKHLSVKPGSTIERQLHHHRAEHWVVVSGTAQVTIGDTVSILSENESVYVPLGSVHELHNPGTIPLEMIEVQSGSYLGEDDTVHVDGVLDRVS